MSEKDQTLPNSGDDGNKAFVPVLNLNASQSEKDINMSDKEQPPVTAGEEGKKPKIKRVRKPKLKPGPNSFRFGSHARGAAPASCTYEVTISTAGVIGGDGEAEQVRDFCSGFSAFPELCAIKGYGIKSGVWSVVINLVTESDVDDEFVSELNRRFVPFFEAAPVFKRELGFGNARYRVLNGGTNVDDGPIN